MSRAQVYWEHDDTAEAIAGLKSVLVDVATGKITFSSERYFAQRREINIQASQRLIFYLLETGQVNEAQTLLNQSLPYFRKKVEFRPKNKNGRESVWNSALASLITL